MIPLIFTDHEVDLITPIITSAARTTCAMSPTRHDMQSLEVTIGAMIETPRACIRADRIAEADNVSFVSIGSNDLTELVFGVSRQDSHSFMVSCLCSVHSIWHAPH
jgi:pyruvate,orthophosphate dikinase